MVRRGLFCLDLVAKLWIMYDRFKAPALLITSGFYAEFGLKVIYFDGILGVVCGCFVVGTLYRSIKHPTSTPRPLLSVTGSL